jgi:2TM domain
MPVSRFTDGSSDGAAYRRSGLGGDTMDVVQDGLREEAVASLKRKRKFWADVALYALVNGLLWVIWAVTGHSTGNSIPWPAWVSIVWGFFLAIDAYKAFSPSPSTISESEIEREMQRLAHHH